MERKWFSLPRRLGGMGINIPLELSDIFYQNLRKMTQVLVDQIIHQHDPDFVHENREKSPGLEIREDKQKREEENVNWLKQQLNPQQSNVYEAITEKGASDWLSALPLKDQDFYLSHFL